MAVGERRVADADTATAAEVANAETPTLAEDEPRPRELATEAGFSSARRVPMDNPFNSLFGADEALRWIIVLGCWWPGGLVGLATWALEEWLVEPVGRRRLVGHLQAGLVSGAWGLLLGLGLLPLYALFVRGRG